MELEHQNKLEALRAEKDEEISKLQDTIKQRDTAVKNSQKMINNLRKQLEPLRVRKKLHFYLAEIFGEFSF